MSMSICILLSVYVYSYEYEHLYVWVMSIAHRSFAQEFKRQWHFRLPVVPYITAPHKMSSKWNIIQKKQKVMAAHQRLCACLWTAPCGLSGRVGEGWRGSQSQIQICICRDTLNTLHTDSSSPNQTVPTCQLPLYTGVQRFTKQNHRTEAYIWEKIKSDWARKTLSIKGESHKANSLKTTKSTEYCLEYCLVIINQ